MSGRAIAERVTVNMGARASQALADICQLTGDTKTEAVSKAVQAYALIQRAQDKGGGIWVKDQVGASLVEVRFP